MESCKQCFFIDNDVEDYETFSLALREVDSSIACMFGSNTVEALEQLSHPGSAIPFFIFVDMTMPPMNGLECLRELRKLSHLRMVPVYMYTTGFDPRLVDEALALGATGFIEKPSGFEHLKKLLVNLLKEHGQHEASTALY